MFYLITTQLIGYLPDYVQCNAYYITFTADVSLTNGSCYTAGLLYVISFFFSFSFFFQRNTKWNWSQLRYLKKIFIKHRSTEPLDKRGFLSKLTLSCNPSLCILFFVFKPDVMISLYVIAVWFWNFRCILFDITTSYKSA